MGIECCLPQENLQLGKTTAKKEDDIPSWYTSKSIVKAAKTEKQIKTYKR